jgi:hypothetical protein
MKHSDFNQKYSEEFRKEKVASLVQASPTKLKLSSIKKTASLSQRQRKYLDFVTE